MINLKNITWTKIKKNALPFLYFKYLKLTSKLRRLKFNLNPHIYIGKNTIIEKGVTINPLLGGGEIIIGENCELKKGCQILSYGGKIKIGNSCSVNPYSILYGQGDLIIGDGVRIATQTVIIPSNHIFDSAEKQIKDQGLLNKGIVIEDDVWIGCGCRILDGITIKKGSVIGAGSVVNKDTDPFGIYVGIPAQKIKSRI